MPKFVHRRWVLLTVGAGAVALVLALAVESIWGPRAALDPVDQDAEAAPSPPPQPDTLRRFMPVTIGRLPSNEIRAMEDDADGFVWVATGGGLARWDGVTLRTFSADGAAGTQLPQFDVTDIIADADHGVWVAAGNLSHVDAWSSAIELTEVRAEKLAPALDGELWIVTHDGVAVFDPETGVARPVVDIGLARADGELLRATAEASGRLHVGTDWGVLMVDADGRTESKIIPGGVNALATRRGGGVWATSTSGLWHVQAHAQPARIDVGHRPDEAGVFAPGDGLLQLGDLVVIGRAAGGVEWFDTATGAWSLTSADDRTGLPEIPVDLVFADPSGGVWASPAGMGLFRQSRDPRGVRAIVPTHEPLGAPLDLEYDGDLIWIATDGSGLHSYRPATGEWDPRTPHGPAAIDAAGGLPTDNLTGLAGRGRTLWVGGTAGGIGIYYPDSGEFVRSPTLLGRSVFDIVAGPENTVWVSVWDEGVSVLDESGRPVMDLTADGTIPIANDRVIAIEPGESTAWIGGWAGLERVDLRSGVVTRWSRDNGMLLGAVVFDIELLADDSVWLATSAGLEHLDLESGQPAVHFGLDAGLPTNQVLKVEQHATQTALWAATNAGLALFDRELHEVTRVFDSSDGLGSDAFARLGSVRLDDGTIYFSSATGLVEVAPDAGEPRVLTGRAHITQVSVDGSSTDRRAVSEVGRGASIEFGFGTPEFDYPSDVQYLYRLVGATDAWTAASDDQLSVTYADLRPGRYRFELAARLPGAAGFTAMSQDAVSFVVPTSIWMRGTTVLIATFGLLLGLVGLDYRRSVRIRRRTEELEVLVSERTAQVAASAQVADEANQSKARFLSMISHELRSPLQAVLGFSHLIEDQPDSPQVQRWANHVGLAGHHLEHMIEDLLAVAARNDLDDDDVSELADLSQFVRDTVELVQRDAESDIAVRVESSGVSEHLYLVHGHRLRQLLINLAENAIRHCRSEVVVAVHRIEGLHSGEHRVRLSVADDGPGIDPDLVEDMFRPFQRGDAATDSPGLGLGLAICAQIAERLGTTIEVSGGDSGLTEFGFVLKLPYVTASDESSEPTPSASRIVVIDDDPRSRELMTEYLHAAGFEVVAFASPARALEVVDLIHPVGVVTDHLMPQMGGNEVAAAILERFGGAVPVIGVTAVPEEASLDAAYSTVLGKPLRAHALSRALSEVIAS